MNIYLLTTVCRKDENTEKEAGNGPFFNNDPRKQTNVVQSVINFLDADAQRRGFPKLNVFEFETSFERQKMSRQRQQKQLLASFFAKCCKQFFGANGEYHKM